MKWILPLSLLIACTQPTEQEWEEMGEFRAAAPPAWTRESHEGRLATFRIDDLEIAFHSFPLAIPPEANVARWEDQHPGAPRLRRWACGGFAGLYMDSDALTAWTLTLDPRFHRPLTYTVKVTGPLDQREKHRASIEAFARSIALTEELKWSNS